MFPMKILKIEKLFKCYILERENRFITKVLIDGKVYRAYVNNTGRLHEFLVHGKVGFCVKNRSAKKTYFRIFAVEDVEFASIIDTRLQKCC